MMFKKTLIQGFSLIIISVLTVANTSIALAAPNLNQDLQTRIILNDNLRPDNSPGIAIGNTLKTAGAESAFGSYILQLFAGSLITVAAPVAIIIIALSGLLYTTARGNQAQMEKAKKALTFAITGLVIIILAWVIVRGVISAVLSINANPSSSTSTTTTTPAAKPESKEKGGTPDAPKAAPVTPPTPTK
jgi:ABC-type multidrug transport system permease subunit